MNENIELTTLRIIQLFDLPQIQQVFCSMDQVITLLTPSTRENKKKNLNNKIHPGWLEI